MVSISRKSTSKSTNGLLQQLRSNNRGGRNGFVSSILQDKERMGMISLVTTVGSFIIYWLFLTRNDTTGISAASTNNNNLLLSSPSSNNNNNNNKKAVPDLPPKYMAIAMDIRQVLNCSQKLPTYYSWNDEMPGYHGDDEVKAFGGGGGNGGEGGFGMDGNNYGSGGAATGGGGGLYQVAKNPKFVSTTTTSKTTTTRDWMDGAGSGAAAAAALEEQEKSAADLGAIKEDRRRRHRRRRLLSSGGRLRNDVNNNNNNNNLPPSNSYTSTYDINAKHLFCLAASAPDLPKPITSSSFKCPAVSSMTVRQALLDVWSAARAENVKEDDLRRVLDVTVEAPRDVLGHAVQLWAPMGDDGSDYVIKRLGKSVDEGGIQGLEDNLGPGKVFVDVGSCLGLTALAVTLKYPGTTVVAIEPALPNWLIMQMNFICNLPEDDDDEDDGDDDLKEDHDNNNEGTSGDGPASEKDQGGGDGRRRRRRSRPPRPQRPHVVLGGVGDSTPSTTTTSSTTKHHRHHHHHHINSAKNNFLESQMAKMLWRSSSTTMTRAWTPAKDRKSTDIELLVALRRWDSILKIANIQHNANGSGRSGSGGGHEHPQNIDVLNVDCQGCEYNLIPSLTNDEYEAISTVMGNMHWGYIPPDKLPSKQRGILTHERLCKHENFARTAKECCAFPTLTVKSTYSGQELIQDVPQQQQRFPPQQATVADVAGELCNGFSTWAVEKRLNEERDDTGWFELTSMAKDVGNSA